MCEVAEVSYYLNKIEISYSVMHHFFINILDEIIKVIIEIFLASNFRLYSNFMYFINLSTKMHMVKLVYLSHTYCLLKKNCDISS